MSDKGIHTIQDVDMDEIHYDPRFTARQWKQPKAGSCAAEEFDQLKGSLKTHGQLQPIVLAAALGRDGPGAYIVCGVRRYFAAKELGWETISAGFVG